MADQVYSLAINGLCGPQFFTNVLHYKFDDAGFTTRSAAAAALNAAWDAANRVPFKAMMPTSSRLVSLKSRCVSAPGGFEAFFPMPAGQVGGRAGNLTASGVAPFIQKIVANFAGQIGKTFLPGITDSDLIDGIFQAGFTTAVNTNVHIFTDTIVLTGGGGPTATPVIWNRVLKIGRPVVAASLQAYPGTIRRRQLPV